jgi:hypothetical protein
MVEMSIPTIFEGPVPLGWITRGVFLSEAIIRFANDEWKVQLQEDAKAFAALHHGQAPDSLL